MRDRLIELLTGNYMNTMSDVYDVADHLIANGVIVPPCIIGEKIYMVVTRKTVSFDINKDGMRRIESEHSFIKQSRLTKLNFFKVIEDFGKTVFLSREDAERALKEVRNDGEKA
jgi:RNA recognition motif-containing protein